MFVQNRLNLCQKEGYFFENLYKVTTHELDRKYITILMNQILYAYASESSLDMLINDVNYLTDHGIKLDKRCTSLQDLIKYAAAVAQESRLRNEYTANDICIEDAQNELNLYSKTRNNISLAKVTDI
jgi:hypothetical protein